jgi:hypothetical protein
MDPEFSCRRYAERVYDILLELAMQGRSERLMKAEILGAEAPLNSAA